MITIAEVSKFSTFLNIHVHVMFHDDDNDGFAKSLLQNDDGRRKQGRNPAITALNCKCLWSRLN